MMLVCLLLLFAERAASHSSHSLRAFIKKEFREIGRAYLDTSNPYLHDVLKEYYNVGLILVAYSQESLGNNIVYKTLFDENSVFCSDFEYELQMPVGYRQCL